jgi:hypothetical protein
LATNLLTANQLMGIFTRQLLAPAVVVRIDRTRAEHIGSNQIELDKKKFDPPFFQFNDPGLELQNLFSLSLMLQKIRREHGQTLAYRTSLGPSFQL